MRTVCIFIIGSMASLVCRGQNAFTFGIKFNYGTSVFPMDAAITSGSVTTIAKSGATVSHGVITRYMIGDKIGIESGFSVNHYSYYLKENFTQKEIFWKSGAEFEILNLQIPIVLNYKVKFPRHPFRYLIASAGTSFDHLIPFVYDGIAYPNRPGAFQNVVGLLIAGSEKPSGNKFEIGIEVQYSLKEFQIAHLAHDKSEYHAYSRLNMLALNLSYFFLNKDL